MTSVIEGVLAIEKQADELAAAARQRAADIERQTRESTAKLRADLEAETVARIETFRQELEARHVQALEAADEDLRQALGALDGLDDHLIESQVGAIVARFRGL